MGVIRTWLRPPDNTDPDLAVPIGAVPHRVPTTLMKISRVAGSLRYTGEIEVDYIRATRFAPRRDGTRSCWFRNEFQPSSDGSLTTRFRLVAAEHPYGNEWIACAPFKTAFKKGYANRPIVPAERAATLEDHARWIDDLPYDYWEAGKRLTAGILLLPDSMLPVHVPIRNTQREGLTVLGTFDERESGSFDEMFEQIYETDVVRRLLADTVENRIVFWSPKAEWKTRPPKLYPEVIDEREALMLTSIRQAFAGPHTDFSAWINPPRPIVDLVDRIYRTHLNNWNRRVARRRKNDSDSGLRLPGDFEPWEQEFLDSPDEDESDD